MKNIKLQDDEGETIAIDLKSTRNFIIKYFDSFVTVQEESNGEYITFRKEGEESFFYDDDFWNWFKAKTDCTDELLSFTIISDKSDFPIDDTLNIAQFNIIKEEIVEEKPSLKKSPPKEIKRESLSEYYNNKTKLLRGE